MNKMEKSQSKKVTIIIIAIFFLALVLFLVQYKGFEIKAKVSNFEECAKAGNPVLESYPRQCVHEGVTYIEKISDSNKIYCESSIDCELPMEYATQSNCPYESICKENNCIVACPTWEYSSNPEKGISYEVICSANKDCNCSNWDKEGNYPCECLNAKCVSIVSQ